MLEQVTSHDAPITAPDGAGPSETLRSLEGRLERGWTVISTAEQRGEPTDALLSHFFELLRQYEDLYDRLRVA